MADAFLFDSHCHLCDERFDEDREEAYERMRSSGVKWAVVAGDSIESSESCIRFAQAHEGVYAAVGIHPHNALQWSGDTEKRLRELLKEDKVVALGEIGLDYYYDAEYKDTQKKALTEQMDIAAEYAIPAVYHIRDAHGDFTELLLSRRDKLPAGDIHCYTGSWETAKTYLSLGHVISLSGTVTFKNANKLVEVAKNLPSDRIMVETDSPYLAPVPMRGKRNEPAFVRYTSDAVAAIRGISPDAMRRLSCENALRFYRISAES
ncbi:MAG: TatD family hydrolase [Eubacteriales bacterium]|nr:TatD family hydrolase [Eubacteriales bacterium]MDD3882062.1 TatD family hydrolase [Eubacteriales bacterium]MDD4512509.1 TatD family hydrolase [Eubacteriales bacterium]